MKSLLALLLLSLALAFGYWKTQYPDSTVGNLTASASTSVSRITSGISSAFSSGMSGGMSSGMSGGLSGGMSGGVSSASLNERLDAIESNLAETRSLADPAATNTRLESLEAAIVATQQSADPSVINGRLTDAERRMAALEAKVVQLKADTSSSLESISTDTTDKDALTVALEDRLELLNRRVEEQAEKFSSDSTGADRFNNAMTALEASIESLKDSQDRLANEQNAELSGMNEKLESFVARFNTLSADASNGDSEAVASINAQIDQRIVALEDKLDTTNADSLRIESMSNELSGARVKLRAMEQGVADANALIADLTRQIAGLSTQTESSSIDGQQAQLRSQLEQLQDQMNQPGDSADITELTSVLQATRDRVEMLEQRVVELPATSSGADEATQAQSALQAQIKALESKLAEVQAAPDPNLVSTLNQVEEKVSALAAKSYVTQEELREQQQGKSIEYKIYFEPDSTEITEDAGLVLNSFIAQEKNRATGVSIYGFTDRIGSATYNQALALQRATNVRSYLIQNGFSYTKIKSLSGLGEDAAANSPDDEEDAQQRSVVLYAQQP